LAVIVPLPTIAVSFVLEETNQWAALGLIWVGYLEYGLLGAVIAQFATKHILSNMRKNVVDKIENINDLENFRQIISYSWETPYYRLFVTLFTVFWATTFSLVNSLFIKEFVGFGLVLGTIIFGLIASGTLYLLLWFIYFTSKLGAYNYKLNIVSPRESELIFQLSNIFKTTLYYVTGSFFVGTAINSFNDFSVWLVVVVCWIPTILLFVKSQSVLGQIITTAKWKTLNQLQKKIKEYHDGDISSKNNIENINRLMDYHERIQTTRNSTFDLKTGLGFLNQLALPLLGFLLANIEVVLSFFK